MASKPKPKRPVPRRTYFGQDKLRAAFLAGSGKSGNEIAQIIGGTTGMKVRAMLRKSGINMARRGGDDDVLQIHLRRRELQKISAQADARDFDPAELIASLVRACIDEPTLIDNILDDGADQ